jgi:hypothetical protein
MDDNFKKLSFADFVTVDYAQLDDELAAYRRKRLKNGAMHEWVEEAGLLDEAISRQTRLKRKQNARKNKAKMAMGRRRAAKRAPSQEVLKKRAHKQARKAFMLKKSRGTPLHKLSMGRRQELERMADKPASKARIKRNALKSMPDLRRKDRERRANAGQKKDK